MTILEPHKYMDEEEITDEGYDFTIPNGEMNEFQLLHVLKKCKENVIEAFLMR